MTGEITDRGVIDFLSKIAERNDGLLLPERVVAAARPKDSPIHDKFTWDNTEAAEKYRIMQARDLISVVVEYLPGDKSESPMRVFVSLKSDRADGRGYRRTIDVMDDDEMRGELIKDALTDMEAFQERYRKLQELETVFLEMKKVSRPLKTKAK